MKGTVQKGNVLYIQTRLNTNLKLQTIEEMQSKMKSSHLSTVGILIEDLQSRGFSQQSLAPLQAHFEQYQHRDEQWFFSAENYKQATNDALDAKLEVCAQLLHASVQDDR